MFLADYINKTVNFNFNKSSLKFHLSQYLFSSFDIDPGSKLLLKYTAPLLKNSSIKSVIDIGCGIGTLGLSIISSLKDARCVLQDRDALAVNFAEKNAELNKLFKQCDFVSAPLFSDEFSINSKDLPKSFDLVVSNIPAKIGNGVITSWVSNFKQLLNPNGKIAVVIVKTLTELFKKEAALNAYIIEEYFENKQYGVYILSANDRNDKLTGHFDIYKREERTFRLQSTPYTCKTVYNLGNFDSYNYDLKSAAACLKQHKSKGSSLFINPGQGHLPLWLLKSGKISGDIKLAGRDTLSLEISAENVRSIGKAETVISPYSELINYELPDSEQNKKFEFVCFHFDTPVPAALQKQLIQTIQNQTSKYLLVYGKTMYVNNFLKYKRGSEITYSHKNKGYKAILFKKAI